MLILTVVINFSILALFTVLAVRYWRQRQSLTKLAAGSWSYPPLAGSLMRPLRKLAASDLALSSTCIDLGAITVDDKLANKRYHTMGELVKWLKSQSAPGNIQAIGHLMTAIYQLQHIGGLLPSSISPALDAVAAGYRKDQSNHQVCFVESGDPVNRAWMNPLNSGSVVAQPFGVAIRNTEGAVLAKASVLCR